MPLSLPATVVFDRGSLEALAAALRPAIQDIVNAVREERSLSGNGHATNLSAPAHYLVSSIHPPDLLSVVEAPDVTAGERNEPHWSVVQEIRSGDFIVHRDSRRKALVGIGRADWMEKGIHRHSPNKKAIRWWLREPMWFDRPIPDEEFRRIFLQHDDGAAGFKLFRASGAFSQKTYAFPLNQATADALFPTTA